MAGRADTQIENGDMRATIDSSAGPTIVAFMQEDKDYTSPSALEELKAENRQANFLEMEMTRSGRELGVNREYLKKVSSCSHETTAKPGAQS